MILVNCKPKWRLNYKLVITNEVVERSHSWESGQIMLIYIFIFIIILIVGFVDLLISLRNNVKALNYYQDFTNHYALFVNDLHSEKFNSEEYQWLIRNSPKMQTKMGHYAILRNYIDGRFHYKNLEVISNILPQIREAYAETQKFTAMGFDVERLNGFVTLIVECLMRYEGHLTNQNEIIISNLKNPFTLLREGIQWIVTLPIQLLYWTGVINYLWFTRLSNNWFIKLLNLFVILVGFASSIVTLVTGYNPFLDIVNKYIIK